MLHCALAFFLVLAASSSIAIEIPGTIHKTTPIQIPDWEGGAPDGNQSSMVEIPVFSALTPGTSFLPTDALSPVDGLPYVEYGDDVHLISSGLVTAFKIGYFNGTGATTVDVTITMYVNNATNSTLGAVALGPVVATGLPGGGPNLATINIPPTILSGVDYWFAVQFSEPDTGLILTPPPSPTVGTSADVFVDTGLTPPPGLVNFQGGNPVANFMIEILVDNSTVAVEQVSWAQIKALYATD